MIKIGLDVPQERRRPVARRGPGHPSRRSACRASCGPASPWAAPAAASPTTARSSSTSSPSGLELSPVDEVLIEESVIGWKEYELEVMRDRADNVVIICSIENLDPMGVHTGDSITVAPAQTLTDKEYQRMRDAAKAIIREIGVETGGSNIQFAINPADGRMIVIEMNPRVSAGRSALASKATGFPIAKIAAKLAVGYTLDELQERHHPRDAGLLRADHRLRRHQGAAVRLREVPRRRPDADHADEVGRRDDGDRPDVQGVAAEGAARPGDRAASASAATARTAGARRRSRRIEEIIAQAGHAERRAHLVHPLRLQGRA